MFPNFWAQRAMPYNFPPPQFGQPPQGFQNPWAQRMAMQGQMPGVPQVNLAAQSMMRPGLGMPPPQQFPMQPQQPQLPMQAQGQLPQQAMGNNALRMRMAM